ncbi:LysR family transcriptional regulator [Rhizobium sp. Root149]|jgi:DNA-binding transcriptional LysR family regulator|uniref:LysR family transcriptional regulator n=1 Tax=Rhizobium sp. Root149 TaxID=1736473 RepID=UPI000AF546AA|nr:LysR family transcriptional regulator [Rhizobium sp. Root149]
MRDLNLKATEYFEAVARLSSVTKAAEELGISPSAVSQQLSLLEAQLGVKLFRREKGRLVLTLDGDRLFQTTTQAFSAIRNARSGLLPFPFSGTGAISSFASAPVSGCAGWGPESAHSPPRMKTGTSALMRHPTSRRLKSTPQALDGAAMAGLHYSASS